MILYLTTIDSQNEYRNFHCRLEPLEAILDIVNSISTTGDKLIDVTIIDDDHCISLPVEAFDGTPCAGIIRQLECEWSQLLNQSVNQRSLINQRLIAFTQRQLESQHNQITRFTDAIGLLNQHDQHVHSGLQTDPRWMALLSRTRMNLRLYKQQLVVAQERHRVLLNQLLKLQTQSVNHLPYEN